MTGQDKRIEEAKAGLSGEGGGDAPSGKKKKKGKKKWREEHEEINEYIIVW